MNDVEPDRNSRRPLLGVLVRCAVLLAEASELRLDFLLVLGAELRAARVGVGGRRCGKDELEEQGKKERRECEAHDGRACRR